MAKKKSTGTAGNERDVLETRGVARSEPPIAVEAELVDESDADDDVSDLESDSDFDEELGADALSTEELGDEELAADELGTEEGEFEASDDGDGGRATALVPLKRSIELSGAISATDPLGAYMREVQRHPLLTREEEHQLALLYHETGDVDAAKKLVTSNLRLVVKIAYEYKRAYKNMMDLVQEGNIGLMQAVKRFDPHRGVKLSSYSAWWIRAYILRYILNNWRLVKLGTTQAQRKLFFNLNKERARLAAMGIEPTHGEIARRLEVSEKDVRQMDLRLSAVDASLDVPVGDSEGRQTSRLDLLPSRTAGPDTLAENAQLLGMLSDHLGTFRATLAGKELEIFDKRMVADEPLTLQQLGDEFGVSRERVRQIEARVTGRLRAFLTQCLGDENEATTAAI